MPRCDLEFENNPMKVIYAGQLLNGTVRLQLTEGKNVRGIYIRIHGKARTEWSSGRRTLSCNEEYLDERKYFLGGTDGELHISPGTYNYSFQFLMPPNLPTSFEGIFGYIRYTAHVVLDIPYWPDTTFKETFTLIRAINLNHDPRMREPVIAEMKKTFFLCGWLCCCSSNPLKFTARTPVGGYTPGQIINLEIDVKNKSDQPVCKFTVKLIKKITYYDSKSKPKPNHVSDVITITKQDVHGCDTEEETIRVNIEIPQIPPTESTNSNIIKVQYSIRIIGSVPCCHSNPVLKLPIIIGSYPILDVTETGNPSAPLPYPDDDLSTYEEAM